MSDWEREVLAGIEDDLATSDPRLAEAMAVRAAGWRPLSWLWSVALVVGLLVLVIGCVLVLGPSWINWALFIAMVLATWALTSFYREALVGLGPAASRRVEEG